jgi:P27 family predicted phage terminase small subunit
MVKGRPAKPTALKVLNGNPGKRALNKQEPVFETDLPEPSESLSDEAKEIFYHFRGKLERLGYASASHSDMLDLLAQRVELMRRLQRDIAEIPLVIRSERGNDVMTPEIKALNDVARHVQYLLSEFGLSPSSATKIVVPPKPKQTGFNALSQVK